jgi:hypothetical protein
VGYADSDAREHAVTSYCELDELVGFARPSI